MTTLRRCHGCTIARVATRHLWRCRSCKARCCEHLCTFRSPDGHRATCGPCRLREGRWDPPAKL